MKKYKNLNNIFGWGVGIAASIIFILTAEPTASFWDCGEFIACAYKLEVGHPPGAPTFNLLGRIVSLFANGDVTMVAKLINYLSAVCSGLSVMFLFWIITFMAKKFYGKNEEELNEGTMYAVFGAGLVGAMSLAFCDSFWFSAVEGEVYSMAAFFTTLIFWCATKWEREADEQNSYRWIILVGFLIGLSIGVHLLNLLAIPAMGYIYYFKKHKPTFKGILLTTIISMGVTGIIMSLIIPQIVNLFAKFELLFVNSFGLPFNSGTIFFAVLIVALIFLGLRFSIKKKKVMLNTIILAFMFLLMGYSTYLILVIRANTQTPISENDPKDAISLLSYLNREQYGDWPILYGQYYNTPRNPQSEWKDGSPVYAKDELKGKYIVIDKREKAIPTYDSKFCTLFPRMWSGEHADEYKSWAEITGDPISYKDPESEETEIINKPTFFENVRFFFNYQIGHMYLRYFLWNFAGKQNDIQNSDGNPLEGNWYSGIKFIDQRLGPQDNLPDGMKHNKGMNKFYFLPLILGFIGFIYQLNKRFNDSLIVMLFFFMTGIAIILYLNQYPNQPRERDYAYAGSMMAFCIWIGLGVLALFDLLKKKITPVMSAVIATVLCFACVPYLMGKNGWDDHNRSGRYVMVDFASDYLNSCAPNAIIFTNGDNDTFPLWYAQEVEGIRRDVRVVNLSLLNTDWYISDMKRKAYESEPVPFSLTWDKYKDGTRDYVYFIPDSTLCKTNTFYDLKQLIEWVGSDDPKTKFATSIGSVEYFPTKNLSIAVDKKTVLANGTVQQNLSDSIVPAIQWSVGKYGVQKSELMMLDLLANNKWKRPVYFASTSGSSSYLGLDKYLRLEGLAYRLVPVKSNSTVKGETGAVNTEVMYNNMMNKFKWGNIDDTTLYFDETVTGMAMSLRLSFTRLANALSEEGKKDLAVKALDKCVQLFPERNVSYNYYQYLVGDAYYKADAADKGNKVMNRMIEIYEQNLQYYFSFKGKKA
ncbi:MAG: DUF2723 domain-containing protein, partial [Bacteroidetes bacterium]|nr:DUF2723 domain-containing protein [Bacteroidota bacterium]